MHTLRRAALFGLALCFSSCGALAPPSAREPLLGEAPALRAVREAAVDNVILVTLDGVRWQEIFKGADPALADEAGLPGGPHRTARGLTPNLHRLFFDGGTVLGDPGLGARFLASGPRFVSLPAYVEIMTGAVSGCAGNDCQPAVPWTIATEIAQRTPEQGAAVFSSWSAISRAVGPGENLLLATGRHPGDPDPAYPGHDDYRPDRRTAALALDHLRRRRPGLLWVALGDTDEWAHRRDYRGYIEALRFADAFVGELCAHLDEMGDYGDRTAVIVTTDHGRDAGFADHGGPDSAAVWLMARGAGLSAKGPAALRAPRHLRDIAPTIAALRGWEARRCDACGDVITELL